MFFFDSNNSGYQYESDSDLINQLNSGPIHHQVEDLPQSASNIINNQGNDDYNPTSSEENEVELIEDDFEQNSVMAQYSEQNIPTENLGENKKKPNQSTQQKDAIDKQKSQVHFDQDNQVILGNSQNQNKNEEILSNFLVNSCSCSSQKADDELQVEQEGNLQNQKQRELGCSSQQIKQNKETIINKKKETKKSKEKTKKKKKATKKSGKGIKKEKKETQKLKKAIKKKGTQKSEKGIKNEQKVSKKSKKIIKKKGTKKSGKKAIKKKGTQKSEKGIQNEMKVTQKEKNAIEIEQKVTTQSKKAIKKKYDNQSKNQPGFFKRYLYKLASSFGENWLNDNYPTLYKIAIREKSTLYDINQLLSIEPLKQKFIESIENDDLLFYILQSEKLLNNQSHIEALCVYHQQLITTGIIKNQTISKKKRQKIVPN